MLNLILRIFPILFMALFSAICFIPAYWLSTPIVDEFDLVGMVRWLVLTYVWCTVCGGLMAIIGFLPAIVADRSVRSLWGRIATVGILIVTVSASASPSKTRVAVELAAFLTTSFYEAVKDIELPLEVIPVASAATDDCHQGYEYLVNLTTTTSTDLRGRGTHSSYNQSQLVVDVVGRNAVIAPFVLEHLSPAEFKQARTEQAKMNLVCVVLSEYGRRGGQAYRNESNGNYLGPAQMSGGIYQDLRDLYPSAGLVTDSVFGRKDHRNLAKAVYLHHDATFGDMSVAARRKVGTGEWRNRAMIACYNLEASQVSSAITSHGINWRLAEYKARVKTKKGMVTRTYYPIRRQTADYLSMYVDGVYEVFKAFGPNS